MQVSHDLLARNLNRRLGARRGFFEGDLEVVAQVRSALRAAAAPAAAEHVAEAERVAETREDVGEVGENRRVEAGAAPTRRSRRRDRSGRTAPRFSAIGEHRVRFGRFLEALLGVAIVRVAIGVVLQRELAIRALDLLVRRLALDAQYLVVVALAHAGPCPLAHCTIQGPFAFGDFDDRRADQRSFSM